MSEFKTLNTVHVEPTAQRILCAVHSCGLRSDDGNTRVLRGERHLQELDHLLAHPESLAFTVLDLLLYDASRAVDEGLSAQVRELVTAPAKLPGERRSTSLRRFEDAPWHPLDDALTFLACRDLLRIEAQPTAQSSFETTYRSTSAGSQAHSALAAQDGYGQTLRRRCRLLSMCLEGEPVLDLDGVRDRLQQFCDDEQLTAEEDPLPRFFYSVFDEML